MFGVLVFIFMFFLWSRAMKISAASETYAFHSDSHFEKAQNKNRQQLQMHVIRKHTTSILTKYF